MSDDKWLEHHVTFLVDRVARHDIDIAKHEQMIEESYRNGARVEEAAKSLGAKIESVAKEFTDKLEAVMKEFRETMGWRSTLKDLAFVLLFVYSIYQWVNGHPSNPPIIK